MVMAGLIKVKPCDHVAGFHFTYSGLRGALAIKSWPKSMLAD